MNCNSTWLRHPVVRPDARELVPERDRNLFLATRALCRSVLSRYAQVAPAQWRFAEGERGDTFYVVVEGSLEVSSDGRLLRTIGPGDFFGEIALLRDVPRTATVSAATDSVLLVIRRMDFLSAVLGNLESAETVEEIVSSPIGVSNEGVAAVSGPQRAVRQT